MASTRHGVSLLGLVLLSIVGFARADTDALWLEPSSNWYGIDGNWSAMGLYVGAPEQQVDVLVSTSLSEIWVIESNGCGASALCTAARGNVFNISASTDWESLGAWELGLEYLEQVANGDYATEAIAVYNTATQNQTNLDKQIVAAINDTDYYTGFFGLGITPGRFKTTVVQSPIATLVEIDGIIPSHSYGYTAGAYYGGQYGTPMSLVLGGYDQNRFVSHDTEFSLNSTTRQPEALIRAITASMSSTDQALAGWNSTSVSLSSFDESVVALVDSSTPYLWLPTVICDRFADALNLTWNETFGLYTFASNATYESYFDTSLAFTFSLSSSDNRDNFGDPLNVAGVVNITISANAFAQTLRYPFMNLFQYGDAAIPYFPLRRADNGTQIIIGRSFLQESYIKMNYESSTFSLHQALFPDNPDTNTTIITVQSSADNPYPSAASSSGPTGGALGTAAIVGIVVGACIVLSFIALIVFCVRRRRKQQNGSMMEADSFKDTTSSVESECPRTPVARIFSRITRTFTSKRSRRVAAYEVSGDTAQPFEAAGQERYELAVPPPPVELDATDAHSINGTTEFGTDDSHNLSPYEIARRKMDKQLQGPVPVYTPGPSPIESHGIGYEKGYQDVSSVPHHRRSETSLFSENRSLSPASTPTYDEYSYLTPSPIPSPMTPHHMDWPPHEMPNISSPMPFPPQNTMPRSTSNPGSGYAPSSPYTLERRRSISRSASIAGSPTSPISHFAQHMHSFQRTPIDQQKVVCLGPLPSGIRPPGPTVPARSGSSAVQDFAMPTISSAAESRRQSIAETLGSNFTVEEEEIIMNEIEHNGTFGGHGLAGAMIEEEEPELSADHTTGGHGQFELIHIPERPIPASVVSDAGRLQGRVDFVHVPTPVDPTVTPTSATQRLNGFDLVHVPQPAQKRYSWEASSPQ